MKTTIIKHLQKIPNLLGIYIFGSVASGMSNDNSDIDIAFLAKSKIDDIQRWELAQNLSISLQKDIDLIDLNNCSEVLKFQIVSKGELILNRDQDLINKFADKSYWLYMDLQELKFMQYQDIQKTRTVYG